REESEQARPEAAQRHREREAPEPRPAHRGEEGTARRQAQDPRPADGHGAEVLADQRAPGAGAARALETRGVEDPGRERLELELVGRAPEIAHELGVEAAP